MTGAESDRQIALLRAELERRADLIELQSRQAGAIGRRLQELLAQGGGAGPLVTVADAIAPIDGPMIPVDEAGASASEADPGEGASPASATIDDDWWPRRKAARQKLAPAPSWRNFALFDQPVKVVGVSVCGLSRTVVDSLVDTIAGQQASLRDFVPVFLTDRMEFDAFRKHGFVWEYFPGPEERARYGGAISWPAYGRARRELVKRKWGIDEIVQIGIVEFGIIDNERPQIREVSSPDEKGPLATSSSGERNARPEDPDRFG